jgi:hypothetical protein
MSRFFRNVAPALLVGTAAVVVVGAADNGVTAIAGAAESGLGRPDGTVTTAETPPWDALGQLFDEGHEGDDRGERHYDDDDDEDDDGDDDDDDDGYYTDGTGGGVGGSGGAAASGGASGGSAADGSSGTASAACTAAEIQGPVVRTEWGPVQVAARVSNGQVCGIRTVTTPDGDRKSAMINARAVPALEEQVLARGDASFQGVSGATVTSDGYRESLQALLDRA